MTNTYVRATRQKLDKRLHRSLKRTIKALGCVRDELLPAFPNIEDDRHLWRWAFIYTVILNDISSSALRLLGDGKHSRAVMIVRRMAFEYRTRFHYYWEHADERKTAMDEFTRRAQQFADRLGPDNVTLMLDPNHDESAFSAAPKNYRNFEKVCIDVFGASGPEFYARFYSYPSALLHGDAIAGMDVLEFVKGDDWLIHLDSRRPFTNQLAANLIVFLLDFSMDVCRAFDLERVKSVANIGRDFNAARVQLGLIDD